MDINAVMLRSNSSKYIECENIVISGCDDGTRTYAYSVKQLRLVPVERCGGCWESAGDYVGTTLFFLQGAIALMSF